MPRVLLLHTMPALYRIEMFNRLAYLLKKEDIDFFVLFQHITSKRRKFWGDLSDKCKFSFIKSKCLSLGPAYKLIKIPLRPYKEFSKISPDIIIANGFNLHTVSAFLYSKREKIPLLVWSGENKIIGPMKPLRYFIRKLLLHHISKVFVYGNSSRDFYKSIFHFPDSKMVTLLNVIPVRHDLDLAEYLKQKLEWLQSRSLKFIYVGELKTAKGIFLLPNFMERLMLAIPNYDIKLTIIGAGPRESSFLNSFNLISDKINIKFMGIIPNNSVLKEMASSHFLLFPTLGDRWGHVISEAFSVGTPVVSSRFAGAVPDMMEDGNNGFIIDFDKPDNAIKRILVMFDYKYKYKKMCKSAIQSYHRIFNSLDNAQTMFDSILDVLETRDTV